MARLKSGGEGLTIGGDGLYVDREDSARRVDGEGALDGGGEIASDVLDCCMTCCNRHAGGLVLVGFGNWGVMASGFRRRRLMLTVQCRLTGVVGMGDEVSTMYLHLPCSTFD